MKIKLRPDAEPVVEPCQKVSFGKVEQLKTELMNMEKAGVIMKINEPTEWVNSMHIYSVQTRWRDKSCVRPKKLEQAHPSTKFQTSNKRRNHEPNEECQVFL